MTWKLLFFLLDILSTGATTSSYSACIPEDRGYCFDHGKCSANGYRCECDDYLHYWPSERCSKHHEGLQLEGGWFCYQGALDLYCDWLGMCSSDRSECLCIESNSRSNYDHCLFSYQHLIEAAPSDFRLCKPGDRKYCSNKGYCTSTGDICECDDFLHYWPSEHCSIWHDGRELPNPGDHCFPDTVDQYCNWMGVCSSDGSECLCFDGDNKKYDDRCLSVYAPSRLLSSNCKDVGSNGTAACTKNCVPGDRSFCSGHGTCNDEGSGCSCDDVYHYWTADQCSNWHEGRELQSDQFCYPGMVDLYCSYLGICKTNGLTCDCFDVAHRLGDERCAVWHSGPLSIPSMQPTRYPELAPTAAPWACSPGDRGCCSGRGYCASSGDVCVCDDPTHFWSSEHCAVYHEGRELNADWFCYPDAVDWYCSWLGVCSSDGSKCLCFDTVQYSSSSRCSTMHPSVAVTLSPTTFITAYPTPVGSVIGGDAICIPYDRLYCSDRGRCAPDGMACVCDDGHYLASERCAIHRWEYSSYRRYYTRPSISTGLCTPTSVGVLSISVTVDVGDIEGRLYCAPFRSPAAKATALAVKARKYFSLVRRRIRAGEAERLSVQMDINGLQSSSNYSVLCVLEDSFGHSDDLIDGVTTMISFAARTSPGVSVRFDSKNYLFAFANRSVHEHLSRRHAPLPYVATAVRMSSPPPLQVTLHPVARNASGHVVSEMRYYPSSGLTFFRGPPGSQLGSFLFFGPSGAYSISLVATGPGAVYCQFETPLQHHLVLTEGSTKSLLWGYRPRLIRAVYAPSGAFVTISLDEPTDIFMFVTDVSRTLGEWNCCLLFNFESCSSFKCVWRNSLNIVMYLSDHADRARALPMGALITMGGDRLSLFCWDPPCGRLKFNESNLSESTAPVTVHDVSWPTVVINYPRKVSHATGIVLDLSRTFGHGGRDWSVISWRVECSNRSTDMSTLTAFLQSRCNSAGLFVPIVIPMDLLTFNQSYFFSLELQNFLQQQVGDSGGDGSATSGAVSSVQIDVYDKPCVLAVDICGPDTIVLPHTENITLRAKAYLSSVSTCAWSKVRFYWKILSRGPPTDVSWHDDNIFSSPWIAGLSDHIVIQGHLLHPDRTYDVQVKGRANCNGLEHTESSTLSIYVQHVVKARINGTDQSTLLYPPHTIVVLDGTQSVGYNLSFYWTCTPIFPYEYPANDCFFDYSTDYGNIRKNESVLILPEYFLTEGRERCDIALHVQSTSPLGDLIVDTTHVIIGSTSNNIIAGNNTSNSTQLSPHSYVEMIPQEHSRINTGKALHVRVIIHSDERDGITATWRYVPSHLKDSPVDLQSPAAGSTLTPLKETFTRRETHNGVEFPLSISPNVLFPGIQYSFQLSLSCPHSSSTPEVFAEITLTTNNPPFGGAIAVSPSYGIAFVTKFDMVAALWVDEDGDLPLTYLFLYQVDGAKFDEDGVYRYASELADCPYTSAYLPLGAEGDSQVNGIVVVEDSVGAATVSPWNVTSVANPFSCIADAMKTRLQPLMHMNASDITTIWELVPYLLTANELASVQLNTESVVDGVQDVVNLIQFGEKRNCSAAPDCELLHRHGCWHVDNTCGRCSRGYNGLAGAHNSPCWRSENTSSAFAAPSGSPCGRDEDCRSGSCDAKLRICTAVQQECRADNATCGCHGTCSYMSLSHESLDPAMCTTENNDCRVQCTCDIGWTGPHCLHRTDDMVRIDNMKAQSCEQIKLVLDLWLPTDAFALDLATDMLLTLFADSESTLHTAPYSCDSVINVMSERLRAGNVLLSRRSVDMIGNLLSLLLEPAARIASGRTIRRLISSFEQRVLESMIPGQTPIHTLKPYYKSSLRHDLLRKLSGAVIGLPVASDHADIDTSYPHASLSVDSIEDCVDYVDYVLYAVSLTSAMHSDADLVSGGKEERDGYVLAADQVSVYIMPASIPADTILTESQTHPAFNVTFSYFKELNTSLQHALCMEYIWTDRSMTIQECAACNVSTYDHETALVSCIGDGHMLCPIRKQPLGLVRKEAAGYGNRLLVDQEWLAGESPAESSSWKGRIIFDQFMENRKFDALAVQSFDRRKLQFRTTAAVADLGSNGSIYAMEFSQYITLFVGPTHKAEPVPFPQTHAVRGRYSIAALSFVCAVICTTFLGLIVFRSWDQYDTLMICDRAKLTVDETNFCVCAAFDTTGLENDSSAYFTINPGSSESSDLFSVLNPNVERRNGLEIDPLGSPIPKLSPTKRRSCGLADIVGKESPRGSPGTAHAYGSEHDDEFVLSLHDEGLKRRRQSFGILELYGEDMSMENFPGPDGRQWAEFPASSLLSDITAWKRFVAGVTRLHSWVRIFTYPSTQRSRVIRYAIASSNLITVLFCSTVTIQSMLLSESDCNQHSGESAERCRIEVGVLHGCNWNEASGTCSVDDTSHSSALGLVGRLSFVALALSSVPIGVLTYIIENGIARQPIYADDIPPKSIGNSAKGSASPQGYISMEEKERYPYFYDNNCELQEIQAMLLAAKSFCRTVLSRRPMQSEGSYRTELVSMVALMDQLGINPDGIFTSSAKAFRAVGKIQRARRQAMKINATVSRTIDSYKQLGDDSVALLQHFILEQVSPLVRNTLRKLLFDVDKAKPEPLQLSYWICALVCVCSCLMFMSYWVIMWTLLNEDKQRDVLWGCVILTSLAVGNVLTELTCIYIVTHVQHIVQPQLRQIFAVLCRAFYLGPTSSSGIHVQAAQHCNASCRVSHFESALHLPAAAILRRITDCDTLLCKKHCKTTWMDFGLIFSLLMSMLHPVFSYVDFVRLLQYGLSDLVISVCWLCFLVAAGESPYYFLALLLGGVGVAVLERVLDNCFNQKNKQSQIQHLYSLDNVDNASDRGDDENESFDVDVDVEPRPTVSDLITSVSEYWLHDSSPYESVLTVPEDTKRSSASGDMDGTCLLPMRKHTDSNQRVCESGATVVCGRSVQDIVRLGYLRTSSYIFHGGNDGDADDSDDCEVTSDSEDCAVDDDTKCRADEAGNSVADCDGGPGEPTFCPLLTAAIADSNVDLDSTLPSDGILGEAGRGKLASAGQSPCDAMSSVTDLSYVTYDVETGQEPPTLRHSRITREELLCCKVSLPQADDEDCKAGIDLSSVAGSLVLESSAVSCPGQLSANEGKPRADSIAGAETSTGANMDPQNTENTTHCMPKDNVEGREMVVMEARGSTFARQSHEKGSDGDYDELFAVDESYVTA